MPPSIPHNLRSQSPTPLPRLDTNTQHPTPLTSNVGEITFSSDDNRETKLRKCWDESILKPMHLAEGYHNVHVLMIKWRDDIDELKVRDEVNDLTSIFRDTFNYSVSEIQLDAVKSQHKLDKELSSWVYENDDQNNLLIVYYAGHGVYNLAAEALELSPDNKENGPTASWNMAERRFIHNVEADVFAILDCCFASDSVRCKQASDRTYQLLAASGIGQTTPSPGKHSFTSCLIRHLKKLGDESAEDYFTTSTLHQSIAKERIAEPPALWDRVPGNDGHIHLRKLKPSKRSNRKNYKPSYSQFLHLGFALKNNIFEEKHIKQLTTKLPKLFANVGVPVVNIKFLSCKKPGSYKFKDVVEMLMVRQREHLSAVSLITAIKRDAIDAELDDDTVAVAKRRGVPILLTTEPTL